MQNQELWQVEVAGNVYETDFAGLTQWIAESSLLPEDKIKCGERPWVQAKLVPALSPYFGGQAPLASVNVATTTENFAAGENENNVIFEDPTINLGGTLPNTSVGFAPFESEPEVKPEVVPPSAPIGQFSGAPAADGKGCRLHPVREATFACRQCLSLFCSECPRTIAKVRLCPLCGDMCNPHGTGASQPVKSSAGKMVTAKSPYVDPHFTIEDLITSLMYPFRFPFALLAVGISSSLLGVGAYLGLFTAAIGGLFPGLMAVLVCGTLLVASVYGSASKAVSQVAYGNIDESFLPDTEDFSIWNTILAPCFLGLGTFAISWGPAMLVVAIGLRVVLSAMGDMPKELKAPPPEQQQAMRTVPGNGFAEQDPLQREIEGNSRASEANAIKRIQDLQKTVPTSPFGMVPGAQPNEQMKQEVVAAMVKKLMPRLIPLVFLLLLTGLWGIFYFPCALAVAGYTESVGATLNPLVGFSMMRQMGANYFKAFGSYLLIGVASLFIYGAVMLITAPLESTFGQTPAHFVSNIISFYFYLVIACIFGRALYRSHERIGFSVAK
jgi:hypothetical protein